MDKQPTVTPTPNQVAPTAELGQMSPEALAAAQLAVQTSLMQRSR